MAAFEADLYGPEGHVGRTKRIFEQSAPFAAKQIVDLATNGSSDAVRLRASQYVVDRVLGPLGKEEQEDALDTFLKGMEKIANEGKA
jgi:hypothetical protein